MQDLTRSQDLTQPHDHTRAHAPREQALPERPSLEHLKNEAKARLKQRRATDPSAQLAEAQRALARTYGFSSWRRLRDHVLGLAAPTGPEEGPEEKLHRLRIEQALPRREITVDAASLDRFEGFYELTPKRVLTVAREGDGLIAKLSGQDFLSIVPEGPRKFFFKNPAIHAQLSFVAHGTDAASAAILHQNGLEQTAHRIAEEQVRRDAEDLERRRALGTPFPGSEAALRRLIETMRTGIPDRDLMGDHLAVLFDQQRVDNMRLARGWGDLVAVTFVGVAQGGDADVYRVAFTGAETEWRIGMIDPDRVLVASARLYP